MDRRTLVFFLRVLPGQGEGGEAVHVEGGRQLVRIHFHTAGLGCGIRYLFNRGAGNVADDDRGGVDRLRGHFRKAGLLHFELNGDESLRFYFGAGGFACEADIVGQHAVKGIALCQQGSLRFVPGIRALFQHANKQFHFFLESVLRHGGANGHFVQ